MLKKKKKKREMMEHIKSLDEYQYSEFPKKGGAIH